MDGENVMVDCEVVPSLVSAMLFGKPYHQFRLSSIASQLLDISLVKDCQTTVSKFNLPVELSSNGRPYIAWMGPFENSTEREFLLHSQKKVLEQCEDKDRLKKVAIQLWESHIAQATAMQSLMLENIQLRQVNAKHESSLRAADQLLTEAGSLLQQYEQQSSGARQGLWPWQRSKGK